MKWCVTTAMRRDIRSGNAANGKKEKGKKRTKLRNKVVIVIEMLATLLLQLMR